VRASLLVLLGAFAALHLAVWLGDLRRARRAANPGPAALRPTRLELALGFVTNFFDTLGIGNFAPTASVFRLARLVPDERIPGTMNVGHTLPVIVEAFLFITIVAVEPATLLAMIAAAVAGAWLGAGVVSGLPRRRVQVGMGLALLAAAALMVLGAFDAFPVGGEALGLRGAPFALAVVAIFVLGAVMTIGVGLYAPCMILVSLLGMDPKAAFPIMMGACAFLMPVASARFVRRGAYQPRAALGLSLGGIPAVLLAALIVKSLPLEAVRWLVVAVATYTALAMLWPERRAGD
jgi:uncharacterized membrane protein YfcA